MKHAIHTLKPTHPNSSTEPQHLTTRSFSPGPKELIQIQANPLNQEGIQFIFANNYYSNLSWILLNVLHYRINELVGNAVRSAMAFAGKVSWMDAFNSAS